MVRMVSIDPGEVHCGTAFWLGAKCYDVVEYSPGGLFASMEKWLRHDSVDVIVVEEFRLYPNKANEQSYSSMGTPEVIGVIKYLVARFGKDGSVKLVFQPATIKKPTRAMMKAKRIGNRAVTEGKGGHCSDAVLHGQRYLWRGTMGVA
jgi:hypothetical protein